jgi:SRSO17 transposase
MVHRPKWRIALEQIDRAKGNGVTPDWLAFDEEYGKSPSFIKGLDERGVRFVGEVPRTLSCLVVNRRADSPAAPTPARPAEQVVAATRQFRDQKWRVVRLSRQTQADQIWRVKAARVWLHGAEGWSAGTYWLIWASNDETGEEKFFLSNAPPDASIETLVRVAFMRWNVEHGFRVAKSELGFTHFEGRNYVALMRHLSLCLVALAFVATQAESMRGEKPRGDDRAGVPCAGSADAVLAGQQARQQRDGVRPEDHRPPSKSWPRRAAVASEEREPAHAARPQETSSPKKETTPTIHRVVKVALYC